MSVEAFGEHDTITREEYRRRRVADAGKRSVVVARVHSRGSAAQIISGGPDEVFRFIAGLCDEPGLRDAVWEVVPIPAGMSDRQALR